MMGLGASLLDLGMPAFLFLRSIKNITIPAETLITPTGTHTAMAMMAPVLNFVVSIVELVVLYMMTGIVVFKDYLQVCEKMAFK